MKKEIKTTKVIEFCFNGESENTYLWNGRGVEIADCFDSADYTFDNIEKELKKAQLYIERQIKCGEWTNGTAHIIDVISY